MSRTLTPAVVAPTVHKQRGAAIGVWGAMTGLGVAFGPVAGGFLREHFWWGSVFVVMAPVAGLTLLAAARFVPTSRDPSTPPIDIAGLVLSTLGIGILVFTIIEAPDRGWTDTATVIGFTLVALVGLVFVRWEQGARTRCSTCRCSATFASPQRADR